MDTMGKGAGKRGYSGDSVDGALAVGTGKRRQYSIGYKRQVVEEALSGKESVSVVARRHDINANLLFNWRKQYLTGKYDGDSSSSLIPVTVAPMTAVPVSAREAPLPRSDGSRIEVVLSGGHRLVVEGSVDSAVLRSILDVLTA